MRKLLALSIFALTVGQASAATWLIGDNDGYGAGIPDNADHTFNGFTANYDGRSAAEAAATNDQLVTTVIQRTDGHGGVEAAGANVSAEAEHSCGRIAAPVVEPFVDEGTSDRLFHFLCDFHGISRKMGIPRPLGT